MAWEMPYRMSKRITPKDSTSTFAVSFRAMYPCLITSSGWRYGSANVVIGHHHMKHYKHDYLDTHLERIYAFSLSHPSRVSYGLSTIVYLASRCQGLRRSRHISECYICYCSKGVLWNAILRLLTSQVFWWQWVSSEGLHSGQTRISSFMDHLCRMSRLSQRVADILMRFHFFWILKMLPIDRIVPSISLTALFLPPVGTIHASWITWYPFVTETIHVRFRWFPSLPWQKGILLPYSTTRIEWN